MGLEFLCFLLVIELKTRQARLQLGLPLLAQHSKVLEARVAAGRLTQAGDWHGDIGQTGQRCPQK